MWQTKTKQPPNRPEHWREGQGRFRGRGLPQGKRNKPSQSLCLEVVRGHKPPGHPPTPCLGVSTRQLPAGDGLGHTRQGTGWGGPGGLRVGRPCCPNLTYTLERRKMQEIARKKKNRQETRPHPPENHGENTRKTRQGEPTNPERRSARRQGGGKTQQGEPHQPREKPKSATRRRKEKPKTRQNRLGEAPGSAPPA